MNERLPYPFMEFFFDTTRAVINLILNGIPRRFPSLRFVVPHAGAFLPILSDRLAMASRTFPDFREISIEQALSTLYYDLAGVSMPKQYDVLRQITPERHLLYGSDAPFTPPEGCMALASMMERKIEDRMKPLIYAENARALLFECGMP